MATSRASGCRRSRSRRTLCPGTGSSWATTRKPGSAGRTDAAMPPPAERLPRFSATETWVHRTTSLLVGVLVATGAVLYFEPLALLFSRRLLFEGTHVVAGLLLPFPTLVGLWLSPELRADVRLLGRMSKVDGEWLRRRDRRTAGLAVGKFNGGEKRPPAGPGRAGAGVFWGGALLLSPPRP